MESVSPPDSQKISLNQVNGPICVMGLSGIGKTYLSKMYPNLVVDTDRQLDIATEPYWPELIAYDRRRAWREFCSHQPWKETGKKFEIWSNVRRKYLNEILKLYRENQEIMILTSERTFPIRIDLYVGLELGTYEEHLSIVGKIRDNGQEEWMNNWLEGCTPLIRIPPGAHLSQVPSIIEWLEFRNGNS